MQTREFTIDNTEYRGDFCLETTMNSGQTSQPPWTKKDNKYYEIIRINETKIPIEIFQKEVNSNIQVRYCSDTDFEEELREKLFYIFDLDYDITKVYDYLASCDKLVDVYQFNRGLRLYKAQNPFECIISSICSANNSIKRWTKSITQIRKAYGQSVKINDNTYYQFPREEEFIEKIGSEEELKSFGVGYRSSYMLNTTKMILSEEQYHDTINKLAYKDAFDKITLLEGVGPKVADCILLYGYNKHEAYPVDVWINRITSHLYFDGKKQSNKKIMNFAQKEFGEYSGYIQLYLFNYARLSGLTEKLKKNKALK